MIIFLYSLIFLSLTIFSYSQVDLNLNLSKNETYLLFENQMKQLGFYNRPFSFWIFVFLSTILIILYLGILIKILKNKNNILPKLSPFYLLPLTFYLFAYPAFLSYDIFNYLFDAKILTKYYQNPYFHFALQYKFDTWTRFMRWTTRVYPYGPIWLLLTIIPVFLGFDKLVLTIFTFKIFNLAIFLGCIKIMQLILKKIEKPTSWVYAFALNPIIIYDFLISMHNESLMLLFLLISIYFFVGDDLRVVPQESIRSRVLCIFFLLLSIGVKYLTVVFLPIYIILWLLKIKPTEKSNALIKISPIISLLSLIPLIVMRESYSWYFVISIALLALNLNKKTAAILIVLSFLIFRYSPFILIGEYNKVVLFWQNWISYVVLGVVLFIFIAGVNNDKPWLLLRKDSK